MRREGSRQELQPCLRKARETRLSQFLQSRRKAVCKPDQNKPRFLAKGADPNGIFHTRGLRGTTKRLRLLAQGGWHLGGTSCIIPIPWHGCSLPSSGSPEVSLLQRQVKISRKVSLTLTLLQSFPAQEESAPWPLGTPQVSGSSVVADTRLASSLLRVLPF